MSFILPALFALAVSGAAGRLWYLQRRRRRVEANRRIEAPNSHYSSAGVRNQEDRERWGDIRMGTIHPLNQEEVARLLHVVDADGITSLSTRDRLFLDNMTLTRLAI